MRCPHCDTGIKPPTQNTSPLFTEDACWILFTSDCPECHHTTVILEKQLQNEGDSSYKLATRDIVYPRTASRPAAPQQVDQQLRSLYDEASLIAADSPRAAGALLRRALQQLIRDTAGIRKRDLNDEIQALIDSGIPGYIADIVDAVRAVGNFAAHPIKSTNSGEIIDVEPGEVDLCFDVLDALFDFYFVEPARIAAKKAALNLKLQEAGKPPLK